jgi:hypothetical protein
VKIVSANGSVTLRGPVKTEAEKSAILSKAHYREPTSREVRFLSRSILRPW